MNAIKFFADMRIDVRPSDKYWKGSGHDRHKIGHRIKARFKKNKVGTAWGVAFADLYYDKGFDKQKDVLIVAEENDIIERAGGWRSYTPLGGTEEDEIKENGLDNFVEAINNKENSELLYREIREIILKNRKDPLYLKNKSTKKEKKTEDKND